MTPYTYQVPHDFLFPSKFLFLLRRRMGGFRRDRKDVAGRQRRTEETGGLNISTKRVQEVRTQKSPSGMYPEGDTQAKPT